MYRQLIITLLLAVISVSGKAQELRFSTEFEQSLYLKTTLKGSIELRDKYNRADWKNLYSGQLTYKAFDFLHLAGSVRYGIGQKGTESHRFNSEARISSAAKLRIKIKAYDSKIYLRHKTDYDINVEHNLQLRHKLTLKNKVNKHHWAFLSYEHFYSPDKQRTVAHRLSVGSEFKLFDKEWELCYSKDYEVKKHSTESQIILSLAVAL